MASPSKSSVLSSVFSYMSIAVLAAFLSHYFATHTEQIREQAANLPVLQRFITIPDALDYPEPDFKVRILSYDPFVAHLENFLTPEERHYILNSSADLIKPSHVMDPNGTTYPHPDRTSSTAFMPYEDPIITRIAERASQLQGFHFRNDVDIQVTSYQRGQKYVGHYDWFEASAGKKSEYDRISTIFGILDANCTQCGTRFTNIKRQDLVKDERWCNFVECEGEENEYLTFKAVPGNAVFWKNLHLDYRGDERTMHAGLPVPEGSKAGLNIWTRITLPPPPPEEPYQPAPEAQTFPMTS